MRWTPPAPVNGAITGYTVTPTTDGLAAATTTTDGTAVSANVPQLIGGNNYTFTVTAQNAVGSGPASSPSAAVTITASGNGPSPIAAGFGQYLYIWNVSNSPFAPGTLAIQSENQIPAMGTWTVEGWLNLGGGMNTYGSSSSWGILSTQGGSAVAGIYWDQNNSAKFVWPGGGAYAFNPCGSCGWQQFVLQYDGANVTGYEAGTQVFQQASSGAQVPASQYAGYSDTYERGTIGLDEFRVSSVARYSGSSFQVPAAPFSGSTPNTTLLWHFDEQGIRKMWNPIIAPSQQLPKTFNGEFPDSSGNAMASSSSRWAAATRTQAPLSIRSTHWGPDKRPRPWMRAAARGCARARSTTPTGRSTARLASSGTRSMTSRSQAAASDSISPGATHRRWPSRPRRVRDLRSDMAGAVLITRT